MLFDKMGCKFAKITEKRIVQLLWPKILTLQSFADIMKWKFAKMGRSILPADPEREVARCKAL